MIYNFRLKEKAADDLKGKWISLIISFLILNIIVVIAGSAYDLLTINLRAEVEKLSEQLMEFELSGNIEDEQYLNIISKSLAAEGALMIYDLITVIGSILVSIFSLSITLIHMNIAKGGDYKLNDLKSSIVRLKESFCLNLLIGVKVFLWSLLFIIPGIIKVFAYSMANYVKAEHPEYSCSEAIRESEKLMMGYKSQLFVFYLSFIGWIMVNGVVNMVIWSFIPSNNAFLILGNILTVVASLPLEIYISQAQTNFFYEVKREKGEYEEYKKNRNNQRDTFSEFYNQKSTQNNNPFADFGENDKKETKEDNDPFSEF